MSKENIFSNSLTEIINNPFLIKHKYLITKFTHRNKTQKNKIYIYIYINYIHIRKPWILFEFIRSGRKVWNLILFVPLSYILSPLNTRKKEKEREREYTDFRLQPKSKQSFEFLERERERERERAQTCVEDPRLSKVQC